MQITVKQPSDCTKWSAFSGQSGPHRIAGIVNEGLTGCSVAAYDRRSQLMLDKCIEATGT